MKRSFLFLQGPASPFFAQLGESLLDQNQRVLRLNFNSTDKFFWNGEDAAEYKLPLAEFENYIDSVAKLRKITDLVIYDDARPIHQMAIAALKNHKIRIHVFEEGYFGENWVTLDERIFGSKTVLPKDPRFYLRAKEEDLPRVKKFSHATRAKIFYALKYKISTVFKKSQSEIPADNLRIGVLPKFSNTKNINRYDYFLADLELSKKASFIRSFATKADEYARLVFFSEGKISDEHIAKTKEIAAKYDAASRVVLVENAKFLNLVKPAKGYITNNSLNALQAIKKGKPVLAMEEAMFNIAGLTNQCTIVEFWKNQEAPDGEIFRKFRNYVIVKTQVNGNFYDRKGMQVLVNKSLAKIMGREGASEDSEQLGG